MRETSLTRVLITTSIQGPTTTTEGLDTDGNNTWVRNLSKTALTKAQEKVLARGPNFAIVPKEPPVIEYVGGHRKSLSTTKTRRGGGATRGNKVNY